MVGPKCIVIPFIPFILLCLLFADAGFIVVPLISLFLELGLTALFISFGLMFCCVLLASFSRSSSYSSSLLSVGRWVIESSSSISSILTCHDNTGSALSILLSSSHSGFPAAASPPLEVAFVLLVVGVLILLQCMLTCETFTADTTASLLYISAASSVSQIFMIFLPKSRDTQCSLMNGVPIMQSYQSRLTMSKYAVLFIFPIDIGTNIP